jgi:hypothetical protein
VNGIDKFANETKREKLPLEAFSFLLKSEGMLR